MNRNKGRVYKCFFILYLFVFFVKHHISFFDADVNGSNGSYIVIHHKNAKSPPDEGNFEQYYIHHHQIDHNLVIEGSQKFTFINPKWDEPAPCNFF